MCATLVGNSIQAQNLSSYDPDTKYAVTLLKKGESAPEISMKDIKGNDFKLSALRGKYVVLDFWASWCPDCREDIPNVRRIYKKFKEKGVVFVGVSFDVDNVKWQNAVEKYGLDYIHVSELKKMRESAVAQSFGVKWIPSMILLDKEGKVIVSTVVSDKIEKALTETVDKQKPIAGSAENFNIKGSVGNLSGVIQKPEIKAGEKVPTVLLLHGLAANQDYSVLKYIADSLQRHGIASVRFDFNGHGKSDGKFSGMTISNEIEDAEAVLDYVKTLPYVGKIGVAGHSQGGVVAALLAGKHSEEFSGLALLAPASVLKEDAIRGLILGHAFPDSNVPDSLYLGNNLYLGGKYIREARELKIYETAASYTGPTFVIHGKADRLVPYTYSELFGTTMKKAETVILDGFDHAFEPNPYRAADYVSEFFEKQFSL